MSIALDIVLYFDISLKKKSSLLQTCTLEFEYGNSESAFFKNLHVLTCTLCVTSVLFKSADLTSL